MINQYVEMKILITGSAGFIGSYVVKVLAGKGDEIVGIDNLNDYCDARLKYMRLADVGIEEEKINYNSYILSSKYPNYKFIKLDLEDKVNIQQMFETEKFDYVCHLAAQTGVRYSVENPYIYINSNIMGFMNILECCRKNNIKHLVYASSSSIYGDNHKIPFSEDDHVDYPVSLYAATKKANELMAHTYSHLYHLPTTGLRFFTVYGPWGRPDMAPMLFAKAIIEAKPIKVFNHGDLSRDFTYIDDIIEGIVRIINIIPSEKEQHPYYQVFNIGDSQPVSLMDFIRTMEIAFGEKAILEMYPMQQGDVNITYADTTKLKQAIGYKPATDLKKGVEQFAQWYKKEFEKIDFSYPKIPPPRGKASF